jgi:hypothetical protein
MLKQCSDLFQSKRVGQRVAEMVVGLGGVIRKKDISAQRCISIRNKNPRKYLRDTSLLRHDSQSDLFHKKK